mmetsp:Transcript_71141/g.224930  ORF Transcript_71141/g.224930 Transcript_71141/m.224930 type:complete len:279 (-) Transcript_71141:114-950(-)|eukprot:CAMPEP_0182888638 /NCGR_PEP_ID=MMETSP0034_2-20130328/21555_1 /TAXON_ID=156128 /ORGANISM="Nephroselmis pyriformis, Strain CCMP717" /LENGTH=278 /DNA_ID=CAMNT_0025022079 /DNA_START=38 /DNA_END=874 /DNA_ORIENTATION=-
MARNEEKKQAMLNRYLDGKQAEIAGPKKKRPYLASECRDLNEADKWRGQILREVGKKVMDIQNAGLGEERIRDLNDEINKLIREKSHWETRIMELGGPNYAKSAPRVTDSKGNDMANYNGRGAGYRYFGAAKSLPGVKELFEKKEERKVRRTRYEMHKGINADYYGFRDEEDDVLAKVEGPAEKKMREDLEEDWERKAADKAAALEAMGKSGAAASGVGDGGDADGPQFVAYVPLPDQKEIEKAVLDKKKRDLLAKYMSEELQSAEADAKELLNIAKG